jgi:hypothetical protein
VDVRAPEERWGELPAVDLPALEPLKWTSLDALTSARNERITKKSVRREAEWRLREAWLGDLGYADQVEERVEQLTIRAAPADPEPAVTRFAILGDTGEGDPSQYAVVRPFLARHRRNPRFEFAFVLSDVIYPAGDSADYLQRFYGPYRAFQRPIYAVPGNHDWDDGSLTGFMTHFSRTRAGSRAQDAGQRVLDALRLIRRPWRGVDPARSDNPRVAYALAARDVRDRRLAEAGGRFRTGQPGSYFRIQVDRLWLVCIDTGMTGTIDEKQAEWLIRVSREPGPKILLTGKPLIVDGKSRPCDIDWRTPDSPGRPASVQEIVTTPEHEYVATIGGDVHNYQRYNTGGRVHLVAGGSGAFLGSTEFIEDESATLDHLPEALYPSPGLSRVHFEWGVGNRLLGSRLRTGIGAAVGLVLAALFLNARAVRFGERSWVFALLLVLVSFGVLGLLRLLRVTRDAGTIAAMAILFVSPLVAARLIPLGEQSHLREYYGGYVAALALFALSAVSLARKLTAPEGMTIRERRPYATLGLTAAGWLLLMLVLSAYGTLTTIDAMETEQRLFVAATGAAVLGAGFVTHPGLRHLVQLAVLWLVLIGGATILLFGLAWNETLEDREAFRYGLFEGIAAVLVATALVIALVMLYARFRLLGSRSPGEIRERAAEAEGRVSTPRPRKRRELMAAILRALGREDWLGPIFEAQEPPMLKSFLDVEVRGDVVKITAYRASGFESEADEPPAVDSVTIPLPAR